MTELSTLLPELAGLPEQEDALSRLCAAWRTHSARVGLATLVQGSLACPGHHPMVPLALRLAAATGDLDVDVELKTRWERWSHLDFPSRDALAGAVPRRAHREGGRLTMF